MAAEIHEAILKAFNSGTYIATVRLETSIHLSIENVPVNRAIAAAAMVTGRKVTLVMYDPTRATDAVIVSVNT